MLSSIVCYVLFETLEGAHMLRSNCLDFETTSSKCSVMGMNIHLLRSANFLAVFFHIFHFDIWHETNKDPNIIKLRREDFDHTHPCCRLLLPLVSSYECECGGISLNANKEWASLKKKWNKSYAHCTKKRWASLGWSSLNALDFSPRILLGPGATFQSAVAGFHPDGILIYNSSILLSTSIW